MFIFSYFCVQCGVAVVRVLFFMYVKLMVLKKRVVWVF